jgi:hypothetical protein
MKSRVTRLQQ